MVFDVSPRAGFLVRAPAQSEEVATVVGMIFMKSREHKPISRVAPKLKSLAAISTLAATGDDIEHVVVLML
jgi:hypothetical protein